MKKYILALDQGTTSSRAILFDSEQNIVGIAQKEFNQIYPKSGWVEHDPMEIYSSILSVMTEVVAQTGIVDEQIQAAKFFPGHINDMPCKIQIRQIACARLYPTALLSERARHLLQNVLFSSGDYQIHAIVPGQLLTQRLADSAGGSGDNGCFFLP